MILLILVILGIIFIGIEFWAVYLREEPKEPKMPKPQPHYLSSANEVRNNYEELSKRTFELYSEYETSILNWLLEEINRYIYLAMQNHCTSACYILTANKIRRVCQKEDICIPFPELCIFFIGQGLLDELENKGYLTQLNQTEDNTGLEIIIEWDNK
jgi:hypothetical protein